MADSSIEIQQDGLRWERVTQAAVNLRPLYIHLLYNHSNPERRLEKRGLAGSHVCPGPLTGPLHIQPGAPGEP